MFIITEKSCSVATAQGEDGLHAASRVKTRTGLNWQIKIYMQLNILF